jgi:hypothetical protein
MESFAITDFHGLNGLRGFLNHLIKDNASCELTKLSGAILLFPSGHWIQTNQVSKQKKEPPEGSSLGNA